MWRELSKMRGEAWAPATDDEMIPPDPAVARINSVLRQLFDDGQVPNADQVAVGHMVHVCHATEDEWISYVESEEQAHRSRSMRWDAATEDITIVEFPSDAHDTFVAALGRVMLYWQDAPNSVKEAGASYDSVGSPEELDLSYGPYRRIVEPLGIVPPGGKWRDFKTLRVEVGVIRSWTQLERKALDVWGRRPGIAYVLCVSLAADLSVGDFKLYDFTGQTPAFPAEPTRIVPLTTVVRMNSRRLMGLPDDAPLPPHFPHPELEVDVYTAFRRARCP